MKTMIFNLAAEKDGALTILNQYYNAAAKDTTNKSIFVVSTPKLKVLENVEILNYPWVKKSWFHRLFFDKFIASKLVRKYKPDEVLSLQNVIVPGVKVKQTLYLHQALPFVEKKFKITENFKFWVYQNIISKMIIKSIRKADIVIVQTKWIKDAAIKKTHVNAEKFLLKKPDLNIEVKKVYEQQSVSKKIFFYPATCFEYKNHMAIVDAILKMSKLDRNKIEVVFTFNGSENKLAQNIYKICTDEMLPIKFVGNLNISEVYDLYSKSILIFPSYIETLGLPILEAKAHECPIIVSDCAFSKELLVDYDKVIYFDPFDSDKLEKIIKIFIDEK